MDKQQIRNSTSKIQIMSLELRKINILNRSIESLVLAAILCGIFTPKLNAIAGTVIPQIYLSLIAIIGATLVAINFGHNLIFPNRKILLLGVMFPTYLIFRSLFDSSFIIATVGNSERHLGILTYVACFFFYFIGALLKLNCRLAVIRILFIVLAVETVNIFLDYILNPDSIVRGVFGNINLESFFYSIVLIAVLIYLMEFKKSRKLKFLVGSLGGPLCFLFLNYLGPLQGQVTFILCVSLYLLLKLSKGIHNFPAFILSLLFGIMVTFITTILATNISDLTKVNTNSFYERLEIYKTSIMNINQSGFFGVGVDRFSEIYYKANLSNNLKLVDNAHSIPLQLFSTIGILGVMIWVGLFFLVFKNFPEKNDSEGIALYFAVVAYFICGVVAIQVVGIEFIAFLIMGALMSNNKKSKSHERFRRTVALQNTLLVGLLTFAFLQFSLYIQQTNSLRDLTFHKGGYEDSRTNFIGKLNSINDMDLLLLSGRFAIDIDDKELGLLVFQQMGNLNSNDQRLIAMTIEMGNHWQDPQLLGIANDLNEKARGIKG